MKKKRQGLTILSIINVTYIGHCERWSHLWSFLVFSSSSLNLVSFSWMALSMVISMHFPTPQKSICVLGMSCGLFHPFILLRTRPWSKKNTKIKQPLTTTSKAKTRQITSRDSTEASTIMLPFLAYLLPQGQAMVTPESSASFLSAPIELLKYVAHINQKL